MKKHLIKFAIAGITLCTLFPAASLQAQIDGTDKDGSTQSGVKKLDGEMVQELLRKKKEYDEAHKNDPKVQDEGEEIKNLKNAPQPDKPSSPSQKDFTGKSVEEAQKLAKKSLEEAEQSAFYTEQLLGDARARIKNAKINLSKEEKAGTISIDDYRKKQETIIIAEEKVSDLDKLLNRKKAEIDELRKQIKGE